MRLPEEAELLRIFIGEEDRYKGRPLYEVIVEEARDQGMAGATVLKGVLGFGAKSLIKTSKILRLSRDLPVIIEIVDYPEHIRSFLSVLEGIMDEGLVTLERAKVIAYRGNKDHLDR